MPRQSPLRMNMEISNSYFGKYSIANYWDTRRYPYNYSKFQYELSINIFKSQSSKGKYKGSYNLVDKVNKVKIKWIFYSDESTPNMRAFFSMLNSAATSPNDTIGYKEIFLEDQQFTSFKSKPLELDSTSQIVQTVPESLKATFLLTTEVGQGSGFFIDSKYAVTNYHVVGGEKTVSGTDHLGKEFEMSVIETDKKNDLALLKVEKSYSSDFCFHVALPLDSSIIGKEVFAVGSPASDELINTVSGGIISGVRTFDERDIIQINAPVNPGNSGGPLIDIEGRLIGIIVAKIAGLDTEGIAFAISREQLTESFNLSPQ